MGSSTRRAVLGGVAGAAALAGASGSALGQQYAFGVAGTGNTFSGSVNVTSTFTGSLLGYYLTQPAPVNGLLSRTLQGTSGNTADPTLNQTISPINGNIGTTGSPSTRPTGTFNLKFTPATLRVDLYTLNLNVIGTSPSPSFPVNVQITSMPAFRTRDPNYTYPQIPNILLPSLTLPLGNATLTSFMVTNTAPAFATATAGPGGSYTFSMTVQAQGDTVVNLNGSDIPTSVPQTLTVTGSITPGGASATATISFNANVTQPLTPTPPTPPPTPVAITLPNPLTFQPPNANVLFTFFVLSGSTSLTGAVNAPGGATPPTITADVAQVGGLPGADGQLTVDDLIEFVNAYSDGNLLADVASIGTEAIPDGQLTVDDLIAFVNSFSGG